MFPVDRTTLQLVHRTLKAEQERITNAIEDINVILATADAPRRRGRPPGSTNKATPIAIAPPAVQAKKKKTLSPEHIAKMIAGRRKQLRKAKGAANGKAMAAGM